MTPPTAFVYYYCFCMVLMEKNGVLCKVTPEPPATMKWRNRTQTN